MAQPNGAITNRSISRFIIAQYLALLLLNLQSDCFPMLPLTGPLALSLHSIHIS